MTDIRNDKTVLVLGATGGIGGAIATALIRHGWAVRGLARDLDKARKANAAITWLKGDAMNEGEVVHAASGVAMIVHGVNPPDYANWDKLVLPMIDNTIAAARAAGARVVLPGTIYNYDPAHTPVIHAGARQEPKSRKGKIRVALERRLADAAPDVPALILRAGDFFGPGTRSSWFSQAMVTPGKPVTAITNVARGGGHSWAYMPDLAEAFARLMDAAGRLAPFEVVQFEGFYDETGRGMIEALQGVVGPVPVRRFPWWAMQLAAPFGGFPREAADIAPYWRHAVRMDKTRLVELIGAEPHTPIERAVEASLASMGCLGGRPARLEVSVA